MSLGFDRDRLHPVGVGDIRRNHQNLRSGWRLDDLLPVDTDDRVPSLNEPSSYRGADAGRRPGEQVDAAHREAACNAAR